MTPKCSRLAKQPSPALQNTQLKQPELNEKMAKYQGEENAEYVRKKEDMIHLQ